MKSEKVLILSKKNPEKQSLISFKVHLVVKFVYYKKGWGVVIKHTDKLDMELDIVAFQ